MKPASGIPGTCNPLVSGLSPEATPAGNIVRWVSVNLATYPLAIVPVVPASSSIPDSARHPYQY